MPFVVYLPGVLPDHRITFKIPWVSVACQKQPLHVSRFCFGRIHYLFPIVPEIPDGSEEIRTVHCADSGMLVDFNRYIFPEQRFGYKTFQLSCRRSVQSYHYGYLLIVYF